MATDPTLEPDPGAGPVDTGPPGGGAAGGAPPGGGGGILAALMKQRQGPGVSAPGAGNQAGSMMQIKSAVDMITAALPGLGAGTPLYTAALNALRQLSKHLSQGAPTAGVQQTMLQDLLRRTVQNALFQRLQSQRASQGQQTNPDEPAGATPQMTASPMPSTPLPGA